MRCIDGTAIVLRLRVQLAKGGEVVLTDEVATSFIHQLYIRERASLPAVVAPEGVATSRDVVVIPSLGSIKAGVSRRDDRRDRANGYTSTQYATQASLYLC